MSGEMEALCAFQYIHAFQVLSNSGVQLRQYFADFQKTLPELSKTWQSDG